MSRRPTPTESDQWVFTLNNYTEDDVTRLSQMVTMKTRGGVRYIVFGKEVGENGTRHLQGTVVFHKKKTLANVRRIVSPRGHFEVCMSLVDSIKYCKKDGDWCEDGTLKQKGKRTDLDDFKEAVKQGMKDPKQLREEFSEICAQYPRFVKEYLDDQKPQEKVEAHPLREWQQTLYNKLILPPDKRTIEFVVDITGNQGKSWFARYYTDIHDNAQIIIPGKKADMAYVVDESMKVFFFDCPRCKNGDFIQYDFLEELKNGYIFSPKYESKVKKLKTPHVVVLMNEHPDMTKLSVDRYSIITLN